ncbi:hypothetical protein ACFLJF_005911, partial [Salmonella enterica]
GNTTPMFVAQGGQIIMNEAFTKSLNVNGRFIVTPDGEVTIRTYPGRNVGQVITSRKTTIYDEQGRPRFESGELD